MMTDVRHNTPKGYEIGRGGASKLISIKAGVNLAVHDGGNILPGGK